jgi:hypothetical protein
MAPIFIFRGIWRLYIIGIGRTNNIVSVIMLDTAVAMYKIPALMHWPVVLNWKAFWGGVHPKNMSKVMTMV